MFVSILHSVPSLFPHSFFLKREGFDRAIVVDDETESGNGIFIILDHRVGVLERLGARNQILLRRQ